MPTVLGLLGLPAPADVQGVDLAGAIVGEGPVPDRTIFSELNMENRLRAARRGKHKVVRERSAAGAPRFLMVEGAKEREAPEGGSADTPRGAPWRVLAGACIEGPGAARRAAKKQPVDPDEAVLERLRSLGYGE